MRVTTEAGPCAPGDIGGIEVRGPNVFAGYWRRPELAATEFTADGFFRTGDLGTFDADGYLGIVGRSKDLVISGGLNVYPKEVEDVLDGLDGVLESAVIGVPDADFGEAVVAVLVAEPGAALDESGVRGGRPGDAGRLQGAQAGPRRRRAAPQHHGQGREGKAPRPVRHRLSGLTSARRRGGWYRPDARPQSRR